MPKGKGRELFFPLSLWEKLQVEAFFFALYMQTGVETTVCEFAFMMMSSLLVGCFGIHVKQPTYIRRTYALVSSFASQSSTAAGGIQMQICLMNWKSACLRCNPALSFKQASSTSGTSNTSTADRSIISNTVERVARRKTLTKRKKRSLSVWSDFVWNCCDSKPERCSAKCKILFIHRYYWSAGTRERNRKIYAI